MTGTSGADRGSIPCKLVLFCLQRRRVIESPSPKRSTDGDRRQGEGGGGGGRNRLGGRGVVGGGLRDKNNNFNTTVNSSNGTDLHALLAEEVAARMTCVATRVSCIYKHKLQQQQGAK